MRVDAEQLYQRPAQRDRSLPMVTIEKRTREFQQASAMITRCRWEAGQLFEDALAVRVGEGGPGGKPVLGESPGIGRGMVAMIGRAPVRGVRSVS